jgi:hypothetical protein
MVGLVQTNTNHQPNQMIIQDKETTIETIGNVSNEAQFKMRNSQKAFQILSSLYSDKPLAIVRELGCNAMDSHIASGQPNRPFAIHIPNALEPWITIQDFGTGISHEDIYEIYSVYFASTKTNTNTQVGMLGLGSKSPFCYTDNFTITSIHNQVKRIYNAYFNQTGMPTISLASQENTKDANGVSIQIPIKNADISNFTQAVFKAFRFFDTKPTISGGTIDWTDKANFEGSFWKSYSNLNGSYAVMGGVTYPIDIYKLDNDHYDIVRKAGLVIKFDIGELDVTPSREALMYHDWVVKAINDKITLVKKDFVTKVEEQVKNSQNLLDAMKALYLLNNQWSFLNSTMINGKVMWNKVDITDPRKSIKAICQDTFCNYSKARWGRSKVNTSGYATLDNNALWYFDDLKKGSIKRVHSFVRGHSNADISINLIDQMSMKDLIASGFPASIFIPTSTLPSVASGIKKGGMSNSKPKGVIALYDMGYQYQSSWDSKNFDLSTGTAPKYYVTKDSTSWKIEGLKLVTTNGENIMTINDKNSLVHFCSFAGIELADIRMVSKNNAKFLDTLGSINLADVVKKKSPNISMDKIQLAKNIDFQTAVNVSKNKMYSQVSDTNSFKIFIEGILELKKEIGKMTSILKYISMDEKKDLTYPSKLVELFYLSCDSWQVGIENVIGTILEMQNN